MGRVTYDSIPAKFRPLKCRLNVVISSAAESPDAHGLYPEGVLLASSLEAGLTMLGRREDVAAIFVIGGERVYRAALALVQCVRVYSTLVHSAIPCDRHMPPLDSSVFVRVPLAEGDVQRVSVSSGLAYELRLFERVRPSAVSSSASASDARSLSATGVASSSASAASAVDREHGEWQYLDLVRRIMETGDERMDRTGVGTRSLFGTQMRFDLARGFPLLTTKRVFWRGVAEELLWFISGSTSAAALQAKGVNIWDGNGSREYLDSIGLSHREVGDLGPVYGFQWRHFGAKYVDMHTDYSGQGVDQLAALIATIKTKPADRRMILSAWNVAALGEMALPPCHMFAQFYVAHGRLSCQMYQRSCDMGLGVPFNIASYALLTHMIAHVCDLDVGELVLAQGDAHVYLNHLEPLREQLQRTPRPFPRLSFARRVPDIDSFTFADLVLEGYTPHGTIKMEMAV